MFSGDWELFSKHYGAHFLRACGEWVLCSYISGMWLIKWLCLLPVWKSSSDTGANFIIALFKIWQIGPRWKKIILIAWFPEWSEFWIGLLRWTALGLVSANCFFKPLHKTKQSFFFFSCYHVWQSISVLIFTRVTTLLTLTYQKWIVRKLIPPMFLNMDLALVRGW